MLVLSRKTQEAVVIGGSDGFHRLFRVKVLEIRGANVKPSSSIPFTRFGNVSSPQHGRKSSAARIVWITLKRRKRRFVPNRSPSACNFKRKRETIPSIQLFHS